MTRRCADLRRNNDGAAAVEFVFAAPAVLLMIFGLFQIGIIGMAHAGLGQAVESGARYATIYPRPTDAQITAKIKKSGYGMHTANVVGPSYVHGTTSGSAYVDITLTYRQSLDFGFFTVGPLQLSHTRRAYQV